MNMIMNNIFQSGSGTIFGDKTWSEARIWCGSGSWCGSGYWIWSRIWYSKSSIHTGHMF
jgi:hypothetical protein